MPSPCYICLSDPSTPTDERKKLWNALLAAQASQGLSGRLPHRLE